MIRNLTLLLPLLFMGQWVFSQTISGTVSSKSGEAIPGVNVLVKGSTTGTFTNEDGRYTIQAPGDTQLVFSAIGFVTTEVNVANRTQIDLALEEDVTTLADVVIIGYGTQKKSDVTGAINSVKPKEFEQLPVARVDQALQGRVPGVFVQNTDGAPNANTTIRIRGFGSISPESSAGPLVVIDGLQGASLSTLNTNDIESVEVLKDASATAIYGARGGNGVILVTTKKGKLGAPVVSYNGFASVSSVRKKIDLMNAHQYATSVNDNRTELGADAIFTPEQLNTFQREGTDWQDAIFRTGYAQNHTLSVAGASDNFSYYFSGNLFDQRGIIDNTSYRRYSIRSNINATLTKKLSVGLQAFLVHEVDHPSKEMAVYSALQWAPVKPIYETDGTYSQPGGGYGPKTVYNPVALVKEPIRDYFTDTQNVVGNIAYTLGHGFKVTVLGSVNNASAEQNEFINGKANGTTGSEYAGITHIGRLSLLNTNMLTYDKEFNLHRLGVTAVFEQQYQENKQNTASATGFSVPALGYNNLAQGKEPQRPTSAKSSNSLLSYMGRLNYAFDDRYLITVTGRVDGSSVFGASNKYGFFPSAAFGWNIANEQFMENASDVVNVLKLRASYGLVGNQAIQPYGSLSLLSTTDVQYNLGGNLLSSGATLDVMPNPDLKWESTRQFNVGIDAEFLNGRIQVSADYYKKNTTDLLFKVALPRTSGYNSQWSNVGELENKGFELYLGGKPLANALTWETGFTFALNRNEIIALTDGANNEPVTALPRQNVSSIPGFANSFWLEVGQPLASFRGYEYEGVWKTSEATEAAKYGAVPGAAKYRDVNGDGQIDEENDFVTIGNGLPKYTFGWNNTLSFKNIDLTIFFQGAQGNKLYNLGRVRSERSSGDSDATSTQILSRWTPTNENTNVPSFAGSQTELINSSRWLEDASYIRLKNIALGYRLPASVLNTFHITSCRIYVSGTNLWTKTDYSGYDPEASAQTDANTGVDLALYPSQKTYSLGLDLKF